MKFIFTFYVIWYFIWDRDMINVILYFGKIEKSNKWAVLFRHTMEICEINKNKCKIVFSPTYQHFITNFPKLFFDTLSVFSCQLLLSSWGFSFLFNWWNYTPWWSGIRRKSFICVYMFYLSYYNIRLKDKKKT